jgi:hypothetical protein
MSERYTGLDRVRQIGQEQARNRPIRIAEPMMVTMIDPPQPRRLEKKKNT